MRVNGHCFYTYIQDCIFVHICTCSKPLFVTTKKCALSLLFLYKATSRLPAWRWIIFFGKCSHQNNGPRIVCLHHPKIIWKETKYPNIAPLFCLSVFQNIRKVWIFAMNEEKGTADSFLNRKFLESASQTHIVSKQIAQNCLLICFVECGRR